MEIIQNNMESNSVNQLTSNPKQNNFLVILLSVLLFIALVIAGFFAFKTQQLVNELRVTRGGLSQTSAVIPTSDPNTDWITYTDEKIGFLFKYPNNFLIEKVVDGLVIYDSEYQGKEFNYPKIKITFVETNLSPASYLIINSTEENIFNETKKLLYFEVTNQRECLVGNVNALCFRTSNVSTGASHVLVVRNQGLILDISNTVTGVGEIDSKVFNQILSTFKFLDEETSTISAIELQKGWYWGMIDQKKINTPSDWIFKEAGRSSCWHKVGKLCQ